MYSFALQFPQSNMTARREQEKGASRKDEGPTITAPLPTISPRQQWASSRSIPRDSGMCESRDRAMDPMSENDSPSFLRGKFPPSGPEGRESPHVGAVLGNDHRGKEATVVSQFRVEGEGDDLVESDRFVESGSRAATSTAVVDVMTDEEDSYVSGRNSPSPAEFSWVCVCVEAGDGRMGLSDGGPPSLMEIAAREPEEPPPAREPRGARRAASDRGRGRARRARGGRQKVGVARVCAVHGEPDGRGGVSGPGCLATDGGSFISFGVRAVGVMWRDNTGRRVGLDGHERGHVA